MAVGLVLVAMVSGGLPTLTAESLPVLLISGLVGILLGDAFRFAGLRRVGPRLNTVVFAFNASMTALASIFFLTRCCLSRCFWGVSWSQQES